jgi:hypothetical protein
VRRTHYFSTQGSALEGLDAEPSAAVLDDAAALALGAKNDAIKTT